MPLRFVHVSYAPLRDVSLDFDDGMIAGLVGLHGSGKGALLRLAAGRLQPESGHVEAPPQAVLVEIGPAARDTLAAGVESKPRLLLLDNTFAVLDGASQLQYVQELHRLRRLGAVILISSHDLPLLERACDVVLALDEGRIVEQGDPALILARYRARLTEAARAAGRPAPIEPTSRRGDRRAEITELVILGEDCRPVSTIRSGEQIAVRIRILFHQLVEKPVVGILIRNRIGLSVYGTNTELEDVAVGSRQAGDTAELEFRFRCDLCPQEYTLTAASHDPDGVAHDWLEEALLFSVIDTRYTAGVANLRAEVRVR